MITLRLREHFTLRQLDTHDAPAIFEAIDSQRQHLDRWLPFVALTRRREDSEAFVQGVLTATPFEYVFTLREADHFAGIAGFKSTDQKHRTTEIGYWMCHQYRGKGLMTEAVCALCHFAFDELGMERIEIKCATGNTPSKHIPERLGFMAGRIEQRAEQLSDGEWIDAQVYTLEKADFTTSL